METLKSIVTFFLSALIFSSCSYRITRTAYNYESRDQPPAVVFTYKQNFGRHTPIGHILLRKNVFPKHSKEEDALALLKKEADTLRANLVNITAEKRPGPYSGWYQCSADFYHLDPLDLPPNSSYYNRPNMEARARLDKQWGSGIFFTSLTLVLSLGLLVFHH